MLSPPKCGKPFPSSETGTVFIVLGAKLMDAFNFFKMDVNFEICGANITLVIELQVYNGRCLVNRIRRKHGFPLTNLFEQIDAFFCSKNKRWDSLFFNKKKLLDLFFKFKLYSKKFN